MKLLEYIFQSFKWTQDVLRTMYYQMQSKWKGIPIYSFQSTRCTITKLIIHRMKNVLLNDLCQKIRTKLIHVPFCHFLGTKELYYNEVCFDWNKDHLSQSYYQVWISKITSDTRQVYFRWILFCPWHKRDANQSGQRKIIHSLTFTMFLTFSSANKDRLH